MRRLGREDGAAVITIGVLLTVILALGALTLDAGLLWQERRELQNGADAAALMVAFDCARDASTCASTADATADEYADSNARDLVADVERLAIDFGEGTVTADTLSQEPDGQKSVTLWLARVFGMETQEVRARAVAAFANLGRADTVPLTISYCDWEVDGGEPDFVHADANGSWPSTSDPRHVVVTFHDPDREPECGAHPGFSKDEETGDVLPGGFGWLKTHKDDVCRVLIDVREDDSQWVATDPGVDPARGCLSAGQVWTMPIFVDVERRHPDDWYRIGGFAAMYVTGFRFPDRPSVNAPCRAPESCIGGFWTTQTVPDGETGGPADFGTSTAKLIR
jgi:Flp pilus assembly protein TadG